jgi:AraC family transcriptional regulator
MTEDRGKIDPSSVSEYRRRLNLALRFIEGNYCAQIGLEDIAAAAYFSPFHFHRIFSSMLGETPGDNLRRIRLEKAAALLHLEPDYSLTRIALETGFSSSAVFARSFRKRFGVCASEFKERSAERYPQPRRPGEAHSPFAENRSGQPGGKPGKGFPVPEIVPFAGVQVAYVRSMEGYGPSIEKAWKTLYSYAYPRGLVGRGARIFGIPLDDPEVTPKSRCRYFASLTVAESFVPEGRIEAMNLEAGNYAAFPFSGDIRGISDFYRDVYGRWLPASGYQPDDRPSLEEYPPPSGNPSAASGGGTNFRFTLLLPIKPL